MLRWYLGSGSFLAKSNSYMTRLRRYKKARFRTGAPRSCFADGFSNLTPRHRFVRPRQGCFHYLIHRPRTWSATLDLAGRTHSRFHMLNHTVPTVAQHRRRGHESPLPTSEFHRSIQEFLHCLRKGSFDCSRCHDNKLDFIFSI